VATHFTGEKANYPNPAQNGENGEELNIPGNLPGKLQLSQQQYLKHLITKSKPAQYLSISLS